MAGASLMPDYYNKKVKLAILLAPVTAMNHNQMDIYDILSVKENRV